MKKFDASAPTVAIGVVACILGLTSVPISASAEPPVVLDASTAEFSFIDASDVLESSEAGESFEYLNVATIGGAVIDATLTVEETFNLVGTNEPFFFMDQVTVGIINVGIINDIGDERDELVDSGCYDDNPVPDSGGDFYGGPIEETVVDDYIVGSDDFDALAVGDDNPWDDESKFLVGSALAIADEVVDDADEDRAINTQIETCGGFDFITSEEYAFPGYVRFTVSFTSEGDPVLLENLTLSVFDIDGGQYVRFFSPTPDSYRVFDTSLLDICGPVSLALTPCDRASSGEYAGSEGFLDTPTTDPALSIADTTLEFYGDDSSDDGEFYEWAAEVTYIEPRSSVTYQFGVREGGGGSLEVRVDQINWDGEGSDSPDNTESGVAPPAVLAKTGYSANGWLFLSGVVLLVGAALLRSSRALRAGS